MKRIVQDSDDELEEDLEADMAPPNQPDASKQPASNDTSHGTGSTESLKRQIEQVHRDKFPSQDSQDEPQSSVSLPEHASKKRKTPIHVASRQSPGAGSTKKTGPITYGKRSKTIFSSSPTFAGAVEDRPDHDPAGMNMAPSIEAPWELHRNMRENHAHHEPAMFPEPSSTVPNATQTQQRVLEAVNAPAILGLNSENDAPRYQPPFDTIPCSDILKFTPAEAGEHAESSARGQPALNPPYATPSRTSLVNPDLSATQGSRQGSSVHPQDSPLKNEILPAGIEIGKQRAPPFEASFSAVSQAPRPASAKSSCSQNEEAVKTACQRKGQTAVVPNSDDDLAAIGFPKEQYKPRPSRSRSLKVDVDQPIDYSVRPKKAKKVSKRRRTTSTVGTTETTTTPQKIRQICDMGFTPSSTKIALKQNNDDVTQTIDWLVSNGGDDELAPQDTPKTKTMSKENSKIPMVDPKILQNVMQNLEEYRRNGPEAQQNDIQATVAAGVTDVPEFIEDSSKSMATEMWPGATPITSPTKVEVVIQKRTPKPISAKVPGPLDASGEKPKRRKTALDPPEPEPVAEIPALLEVTAAKKRGRGRPKKATVTAASAEPIQEALEVSNEQPTDEVLETVEPKVVSRKSRVTSESTVEQSREVHPEEPEKCETPMLAPLGKEKSQSTDSQTPERSSKPVSDSPLNKGKVPYRVGLSKRARIAPLLRTLKK